MKKMAKLNLNLRERIASVANDDDITVNFRDANYSSIDASDVVIADQFGDGQTRFIGTSIEETMTDTLEAAKADNVTADVTSGGIKIGHGQYSWTVTSSTCSTMALAFG